MTRAVLESLMVAFCAGDEFFLSRIRMRKVVLKTERYISELPLFFLVTFRVVLFLLEFGGPPLTWKFRRFTRMPLERQLEYLEGWEHSRFALKRVMFKLVKACCVGQILSEKRLLEGIGYGPALEKRMNHPSGRGKVMR